MSITIHREPARPGDAAPAADASRLGAVVRMKTIGGVLVAAGAIAATGAALRLPGAACWIGLVAIALVVVFAYLAVSLLGDVAVWRGMREWERSLAAVRTAGEVEVLRLAPDAAWSVAPIDEDADAVLLRCGDRFLYLNVPLDDAIDDDAGGDRVDTPTAPSVASDGPTHRRLRAITAIRRWPQPVGEVLEVVVADQWIALGSLDRVDDDDPHLQAIGRRSDWMAAELDAGELPDGWRGAIRATDRSA